MGVPQGDGVDIYFQPRFLGQLEAEGDAGIVWSHAQQASHNGPVGAVARAGGGEGAVEGDVRPGGWKPRSFRPM